MASSAADIDACLTTRSNGVAIDLNVHPKARRDDIVGIHDDRLKIRVNAAPEGGRANDAVLDLLADRLGLKRNQLSLISGATGRLKRVVVTGISRSGLAERLAGALAEA